MTGYTIEPFVKKAWKTGCIAEITITNTTDAHSGGLSFDLGTAGRITALWRADWTPLDGGGGRVTLEDGLAPGESHTIRMKIDCAGEPRIVMTQVAHAEPPLVYDPSDVAMEDVGQAIDEIMRGPETGNTDQSQKDPVQGAPAVEEPPVTELMPPVEAPPATEKAPTPPAFELPADASIVEVETDTTARELQALIDNSPAGTVLRLAEGVFHFDRTITVDRNDISVIGAGSDRTVIKLPDDLGREAFALGSAGLSGDYGLAAAASEGATRITLTEGHGLAVGDHLYLARESTKQFFDEIGDTAWRKTDVPLRTSIVEIAAVDGREITLADGLHFDFDTKETRVREIDLNTGIRVGGFEVDYGLSAADPADFANRLSGYNRDAVIQIEGTSGLELFDVKAHDIPSLGINVALSREVSLRDAEMTGAHNKGAGGNGYALQIRDVYDSTFEGLADAGMRHSVVFASWRSAVGNKVHVSSTDRDINFHGGRDHDNVVMVDRSIRDARADKMSTTAFVNTMSTHYGSATEAGANVIRFAEALGSRRNDEIHGYDSGSKLAGAGGHDVLVGGEGRDLLIGGEGNDKLIGGAGTDVAIYEGLLADHRLTDLADGAIEVRDLQGSEGRDMLIGVEWLAFDDKALRLSDKAVVALSEIGDLLQDPTGFGDWTNAPVIPEKGAEKDVAQSEDFADDDAPDQTPAGDNVVILRGSNGKDVFRVDTEDTVVQGLGNWDVVHSSVDFSMSDDVEKLELVGLDPIDGTGSDSDDLIGGNETGNVIRGMGGADRIWARGGDDTLFGGDGADYLDGGEGDDVLSGGAGADTLRGGSGADVFRLHDVVDSRQPQADSIIDFESGSDVIDLSLIDANTGQAGDQAFQWGGQGAGRLYREGDGIGGDLDGDGWLDFHISLGGAKFAVDDFVF